MRGGGAAGNEYRETPAGESSPQEGAEAEERPGVPAGDQPQPAGAEGQTGRVREPARLQAVPCLLSTGEIRPAGWRQWCRSPHQFCQGFLGSSLSGNQQSTLRGSAL